MGADTSFDFGWNQRGNNAAPWDKPSPTGSGSGREAGRHSKNASRTVDAPVDPDPVSEYIGYSGFVAVITDDLQVDAFEKCVIMQFNLAREEIRKMTQAPAPQSTGSGTGTGTGTRSGSGTQNRQRSGLQFLKVEQMTRDMREARIMDYQLPPDPGNGQRKFNDVILKLYYNGGIVLWGLKFTSPNYQTLYEIMGPDFDEWKEKKFLLGTEVREFDQRVFAHVEPIPVSGDGKRKK